MKKTLIALMILGLLLTGCVKRNPDKEEEPETPTPTIPLTALQNDLVNGSPWDDGQDNIWTFNKEDGTITSDGVATSFTYSIEELTLTLKIKDEAMTYKISTYSTTKISGVYEGRQMDLVPYVADTLLQTLMNTKNWSDQDDSTISYTFLGNGQVTMTVEKNEKPFTYTVTGDKIIISSGDATISWEVVSFNEKKVTGSTDDGEKMVLVKK